MAEEQVLIRLGVEGADAAAAELAKVTGAAQRAAKSASEAAAQGANWFGSDAGLKSVSAGFNKLEDAAGGAALGGKLIHKEMNAMLPMLGMFNPRLAMVASMMERVRYISVKSGGSLKDFGVAMMSAMKSLLQPEILLAAVAIAAIAYAYEKVTDSAKEAKKKIDEATEAIKKQREEQEKLRKEQEKGGQKTAAELTLGLLAQGADTKQVGAVTDAVAAATKRNVPDAAARAIGLTGPGLPAPTADDIIADFVTEMYAKRGGSGNTTPASRKFMKRLPGVQAAIVEFGKAFEGMPAGEPGQAAGESAVAENAAAELARAKTTKERIGAARNHEIKKMQRWAKGEWTPEENLPDSSSASRRARRQEEAKTFIQNYYAPVIYGPKNPMETKSPSSKEVIPYVPM